MDQYWTYKPNLIPPFVFEPLLLILKEFCQVRDDSSRVSCVFTNINKKIDFVGYKGVIIYDWSDAPPILYEIYKFIIDFTKEEYDYVLVHIYPNGKASIGYHNDTEAMNSSIASLSLGATRKFRLKKIGRTKGWDAEYDLNNGDLIWMHGPDPTTGRPSCQKIYLHTVPIERKVKEPRINLTFRQFK